MKTGGRVEVRGKGDLWVCQVERIWWEGSVGAGRDQGGVGWDRGWRRVGSGEETARLCRVGSVSWRGRLRGLVRGGIVVGWGNMQ